MFAIGFKENYLGKVDNSFVGVVIDSPHLIRFKDRRKAEKYLKRAQYKWKPLRRFSREIIEITKELSPVTAKMT